MDASIPACLILTTLPADADAVIWSRPLIEGALAACVSVWPPMTSIYRWQGAVEEAREQQVIIKTTAAGADAVRAWIAAHHPYDVPEVLVLPVAGGGEAYLAWIAASVGERRLGS